MPLNKKPRKFRIERQVPSELQDETAHLWAISYSDFLMVLLCFFILFFSVDQKEKEDIIRKISDQTDPINRTPAKTEKALNPNLPKEILEIDKELTGYYVERSDNNRQIIIFLPDNIFGPGQFEIGVSQEKILTEVLEKIRPHQDGVNLTFVGHTDPQPVSNSKNRYLSDNFDLSSLRATKALQSAARSGFDSEHMYAKGTATNIRGSRTISVVINAREATL